MRIDETGFWSDVRVSDHTCDPGLAAWIAKYLPKDVMTYDLGCGPGEYLARLQLAGFWNLRGFEAERIVPSFYAAIQTVNLATSKLADFKCERGNVITLEVAEHIPAKYQSAFLQNVNAMCLDNLVLSWALRGQGGSGHVNERNNNEVIPLVEQLGFRLRQHATDEARASVTELDWFRRTLLVFKRA